MLATRPGTTELLRSIACYDLVGLHGIVAMVASTAAGRPAVACRREMEQPVLLQKMDRAGVRRESAARSRSGIAVMLQD